MAMAAGSKARGVVPAARLPDKLSLLRNHPLFRELPPATLDHISAYLRRRSVPKGTVIFRKGDPGVGMIGVLSGAVRISVASADGRDVVLNIIREGEVFGEIALLDGRARTADATTMSDCELMTIERREFIPFLRSQPDVTLKLMEILCSRLRRTSEQVHEMTFLNLSTRIAKTLMRLAEKAKDTGRGGKVTITQREISQIVGRSRESTNKRLRAWEKSGWIRLQRGSVTVLMPDKLEHIVATSSDFDEA
jgi:CRP/FNR family transcriptional regulator, cyclic AMP receptor protein